MSEIVWKQRRGDKNDLIAVRPEGLLRVEKLNSGIFWWAFYHHAWTFDCWELGNPGTTLEEAKTLCENKYKSLIDAL